MTIASSAELAWLLGDGRQPSLTVHALAALHGLTYGLLHVVGPDHLGTLIAFSVSSTPRRAFWLGASWSLGHGAGMVLVAAVFLAVQHFVRVNTEAWEHYGDYAIGLSMLICGCYFSARETAYLQDDERGRVVARPCSCQCGPVAGRRSYGSAGRGSKNRLIKDGFKRERPDEEARSDSASHEDSEASEVGVSTCSEEQPLLSEAATARSSPDEAVSGILSDYSGALVGILQGLCCPMGMVGIVFLSGQSGSSIAVFLVVFLVVSALGTGGFAGLWSSLTSLQVKPSGVVASSWTRTMYRSSCAFTICLGLAWIIANYLGVLHYMQVEPHAHAHQVAAAGTS